MDSGELVSYFMAFIRSETPFSEETRGFKLKQVHPKQKKTKQFGRATMIKYFFLKFALNHTKEN